MKGLGMAIVKRMIRPRRRPLAAAAALVPASAVSAFAAEAVTVFPSAPYDAFVIYESLAVFWIAIIGLVVIIRMKLREIERTQALGAHQVDKDAPLLP